MGGYGRRLLLFERILSYAADRANKIIRDIRPKGARRDTDVRIAGGLVIYIPTYAAYILFHKNTISFPGPFAGRKRLFFRRKRRFLGGRETCYGAAARLEQAGCQGIGKGIQGRQLAFLKGGADA